MITCFFLFTALPLLTQLL